MASNSLLHSPLMLTCVFPSKCLSSLTSSPSLVFMEPFFAPSNCKEHFPRHFDCIYIFSLYNFRFFSYIIVIDGYQYDVEGDPIAGQRFAWDILTFSVIFYLVLRCW